MKRDNRNRKYGYIFFPDTGEEIKDVWLTITDEEIYFECSFTLHGFDTFPIVCGVFNGMSYVTFIDVFTSGGQSGNAGSYRKFVVTWMLKNKHFKSLNELKFKKVGFREEALKNWSYEPFSINSKDYCYTLPEPIYPIQVKLNSFQLTWELAHYIENDSDLLSITKTSSVISEFNQAEDWNTVIDHILKLKKLIMFLTNKDPAFSNFYLGGGVELVFVSPKLYENKFPTHIQLDYNNVKTEFEKIAKEWFDNSKLEPITDLTLEKYFNVQIPHQRHFFNLAVGLEAFHTEFIKRKVSLHDEEVKINRDKIKDMIEDEALRSWYRDKSSKWKEPSLKDRLIDMKETILKVSEGIFDYSTDELITKIKQTRDDIAHAGIFYKRFETRIELMIVTKIVEFTLRIKIYEMFGLNITDEMYKEANFHCRRMGELNGFELAK